MLLEFLGETTTIRDVVKEGHDLSVELADGSVGPLAAVADDLLPSLGECGDGNAEAFGGILLWQLEVLCDLGVPLTISDSDGWDAELVASFLPHKVGLHQRAFLDARVVVVVVFSVGCRREKKRKEKKKSGGQTIGLREG